MTITYSHKNKCVVKARKISKFLKKKIDLLKYSTCQNLTIALSFGLLPQINKQNINKLLERVIRLVYDDYTFTFETLVRKDHTFSIHHKNMNYLLINTAQRMKFSIKDFFSKYDQIRRKADLSILSVNSTYKGLNSQTYYGAAIWNSLSL